MGEFRPQEFTLKEVSTGRWLAYSPDGTHTADAIKQEDGSVRVDCCCSGKWRIGASRAMPDEFAKTFEAHLAYANRPVTRPD